MGGGRGKERKKTRFRILVFFFYLRIKKSFPSEIASFLKRKKSEGRFFVDLTLVDLDFHCLG